MHANDHITHRFSPGAEPTPCDPQDPACCEDDSCCGDNNPCC